MNLKELAKSKGTNISKLAEKCGIPASTLYSISSGDTNFDNVGISKFVKLAEALGVNIEDLYHINDVQYFAIALEDNAPVTLSGALTANERELLDCYRAMTPERRETTLEDARNRAALSRREKNQADNAESA